MMDPCHVFELAIEKKARGALEASRVPELESHLESCATCREYRDLVHGTEDDMRIEAAARAGRIEWDEVSARLRWAEGRYRRAAFRVAAAALVLVAAGALAGLPRLILWGAGAASLLPIYGLIVWLRARRSRRIAGQRDEMLEAYRRDVVRSLRLTQGATVFSALSGLAWFATGLRFGALGPVAGTVFIALAIYWAVREVPRLKRQQELLA